MDASKKTCTRLVSTSVKTEGSDEVKNILVMESRSFRIGELGKLAENATNETITKYLKQWVTDKADELGWKLDKKQETEVFFQLAPSNGIALVIFSDSMLSEIVRHCMQFDLNIPDSIEDRIKDNVTVTPGPLQKRQQIPWTLGSVCQCPRNIPTVPANGITETIWKGKAVPVARLDSDTKGRSAPVPLVVLPDIDKEAMLKVRTKSFAMLTPKDQGHLTAMEKVMQAKTMEQVLEAEKELEAYESRGKGT